MAQPSYQAYIPSGVKRETRGNSVRDSQIDLLRFIALSLMILAHVYPPEWLFQLRNFDVPLMVLVSGMAFVQSHRSEKYSSYVWKRFKRLVLPSWLILTAYFLFIWVTSIHSEHQTFGTILGSYSLIGGIGYVWIIRVLLLVALVAPVLLAVNHKVQSNLLYLSYLLLSFVFYELIAFAMSLFATGSHGEKLVSFVFEEALVYSVVFALGIRINRLKLKEAMGAALFCFLVCVSLGAAYYLNKGSFVPTQDYKYPPSAYYVSYGLALSILSWVVTQNAQAMLQGFRGGGKVILFIARNSLWIYLWHIPLIIFAPRLLPSPWPLTYLSVYGAAVLMAYFQVVVVERLVLPLVQEETVRKNIQTVLVG
jgi:peptidoglycan/LPS O-acetylase OafA/YrhL